MDERGLSCVILCTVVSEGCRGVVGGSSWVEMTFRHKQQTLQNNNVLFWPADFANKHLMEDRRGRAMYL